jgi:hypothetical protein
LCWLLQKFRAVFGIRLIFNFWPVKGMFAAMHSSWLIILCLAVCCIIAEKYCWLVADKLNEQDAGTGVVLSEQINSQMNILRTGAARRRRRRHCSPPGTTWPAWWWGGGGRAPNRRRAPGYLKVVISVWVFAQRHAHTTEKLISVPSHGTLVPARMSGTNVPRVSVTLGTVSRRSPTIVPLFFFVFFSLYYSSSHSHRGRGRGPRGSRHPQCSNEVSNTPSNLA